MRLHREVCMSARKAFTSPPWAIQVAGGLPGATCVGVTIVTKPESSAR